MHLDSRPREGNPPEAKHPPRMEDRPRVLIVDDTPENIFMLSATLKHGYVLTTATNGGEALALAAQAPHPDLILLDVCMPDMDGYQVCEILKKTPGCANIPIVFVTGLSSAEEERVGLRAGAVDYITKPFHPELVKARVNNHIELKRHRDNLEQEVQRRSRELVQATLARTMLENDLRLALKLQLSLLPPARYRSPQTGGCDIATVLRPARAIGGDFYDYLHLSPQKVLFTLGDVSDKGVASALFMVRVVTLLHWLAPTSSHPSELLESLNKALCHDNDAGMFVTLGCGLVDLDKGEVLYASGGHEEPILVTPGRAAQQLKVDGGPALGLYEDSSFPSHCWTLKRGQSLVLLSDGVTEANDSAAREFGQERLVECLGYLADGSPSTVLDACLQAVEGFTAGAELSDDLTLLTLQPGTSQRYHWEIPCCLEALVGFTESLHQALRNSGCGDECLNDMDLVTEELLVNTIRYGFPQGSDGASIEVSLWADAYHVHLVLRDNGIAFNPLEAEEREEDKVGGWGIPLIKNLMDQFDYQRIGEINEITVLRREREN